MRFEFKNLPLAAFLALALTGPTVPTQARAQTYQIDCAILLCLSGGWPASVPCCRVALNCEMGNSRKSTAVLCP